MAENINTANLNTSASVTPDNHSSPWTRNVRGESEPPIISIPLSLPSMAVIESSVVEEEDEGDESASSGPNGNAGKRVVWNKPSNAADIGPVMGTNKWPALSAKAPSKLSSDSPRVLFDGSSSSAVPVSQGSGSVKPLSAPQKPVSSSANANSNLTPNHAAPARQRSTKHNSSNSTSNGGLSQPPPQGLVVELPINSPSSRVNIQRTGFVSQSHAGGNDHPHPNPRNSFRHRNGGTHPRGDGSHNQNYGGRRNQDHGNHEWTGRNFNSRDGHMQPRGVPRLMRHPPPPPPVNTIPFIAPTPMRPFGTPMGYPEMGSLYILPAASPDSLRPFPFVGPPIPPAYFQAPEPPHDNQLHAIVNQIDYYFSNENLIKDTYLRQNMDDQGWVPIKLIAGFKKVSLLTKEIQHITDALQSSTVVEVQGDKLRKEIQLITDALQSSTVVEVQGDKLRKRIDWKRWIMPPSVQFPTISGQDKLVDHVQSISLEQKTTNQSGARRQVDSNADGLSGRPSFGDFNSQSRLFNSEVTAVGAQGGSASN